jgi:anhydro-N-acetylmuramic acid kinase
VGDRVSQFEQIAFHSSPCVQELRDAVFELKAQFKQSKGLVTPKISPLLDRTSMLYHKDVNAAVTAARAALRSEQGMEIDLIGFHGQTVGHAPPSVTTSGQIPYTIQLVTGSAIADLQNVVTVSDFRSDDLLNGGEGAPFAPGFNALLTPALGVQTAAFINAGNTSNIALIDTCTNQVRGWDCGPCNQFPDLLMREEQGAAVDTDGAIALTGAVAPQWIRKLWDSAVLREDGSNALEIRGPRSFDPQWYRLPAELQDRAESFADRMRTVIAFSAYCVTHSLAIAATEDFQPEKVLLFGGGWKNPALLAELKNLVSGRASYILPEHAQLFANLSRATPAVDGVIRNSDDLGLPSNGMEAGIFAFAAIQRILNQPFTQPSFTNCKSPTRCGTVHTPASGAVSSKLVPFNLKDESMLFKDKRLGRAAPANR